MNLLDVMKIITIDVIFKDGHEVRHDIVDFENHEDCEHDILQTCIEFVLANESSYIQIQKSNELFSYTCFMVEDYATYTKLILKIYDVKGYTIELKSQLVKSLAVKDIQYSPLAVKIFPQILGNQEFIPDISLIQTITLQDSKGIKVKKHIKPVSITNYGLELLLELQESNSLWFKVIKYPLFEVQGNLQFQQHWLVDDQSIK